MISRRLLRSGAAVALGLLLAVGVAAPASADVVCVGDECDGGLWQAARGSANQNSYWGMGAGHDCTNYVAWKLISNGVSRPPTGQGNAADWAAAAIADGYLVDRVPAVGAVAQWSSYEGGTPYEGHVAYVERVNDDGTILLSEDFWRYDGSGPLTYRTIAASDVPRFIHYGDVGTYLRQVVAGADRWTQRSTGLAVDASLMSAVSMGGTSPQVVHLEGGLLHVAHADANGWHEASTGIASQARSLSAINMGGAWPTIVSLEGTKLMISTRGERAWSSLYTGIDISGEIAAVNTGGTWPTILVAQGGQLFTVSNAGNGWAVALTGLEASGHLAAVSLDGGLVDAYSVAEGTLYRLWFDGTWWHRDSTGLAASSVIAATSAEASSQAVVVDAGMLAVVYRDSVGWNRLSTGVEASATTAAADMGGLYPVVLQNR